MTTLVASGAAPDISKAPFARMPLSATPTRRRVLGTIEVNTPPSAHTAKKLLKPSPKPIAAAKRTIVSIFGRTGVLSARRGKAPDVVTVFGEEGVLEEEVGPPPASQQVPLGCLAPSVVAFGDEGVLEAERGATPPVFRAEGRAAALAVQAFVDAHADAEWDAARGKVTCVTTGHEMPPVVAELEKHWGGKRYRRATHSSAPKLSPSKIYRLLSPTGATPAKKKKKAARAAPVSHPVSTLRGPASAAELWTLEDATAAASRAGPARLTPSKPVLAKRAKWKAHVAAFLSRGEKEKKAPVAASPLAAAVAAAPAPLKIHTPKPPAGERPASPPTPPTPPSVCSYWEARAEAVRAEMATPAAEVVAEVKVEAETAEVTAEVVPVEEQAAATGAEVTETAEEAAPEAKETLSAAEVKKMKVVELREALATRGLGTKGLKAELAARLLAHLEGATLGPVEEEAVVDVQEAMALAAAAQPSPAKPLTPPRSARATRASKRSGYTEI